jgi:hypothetical protein
MCLSRIAASWTLLLSALCAQQVLAQTAPAVSNHASQAPFNYVLGQTTLPEAVSYWRASGAHILRAGHLALGTGKGIDGVSKTSADKVMLVDVAGIDFEGITSARFGFFEEKLYRIQAMLRPGLLNAKTDLTYDKGQLTTLEARLRQKYGQPIQQERSLFVKKNEGADLLTWTVNGGSLRLVSNLVNGSLILTNDATEASIHKYVKEYCKTVNTPGHIVCW